MADPFVAEIRIFPFNFAPKGWAWCNGQLLPLSQNTALFSLLGTTYGDNGQTTFALPDLRSRVPLGAGDGQGNGKSARDGGGDGRERGGAPRASIDTASLRAGVLAARERQSARNDGGAPNARLTTREIDRHCGLSRRCVRLLREAHARLGLSARGTHRVLRVARTIADLEGRDAIAEPDIAEAIQYRALDREA